MTTDLNHANRESKQINDIEKDQLFLHFKDMTTTRAKSK